MLAVSKLLHCISEKQPSIKFVLLLYIRSRSLQTIPKKEYLKITSNTIAPENEQTSIHAQLVQIATVVKNISTAFFGNGSLTGLKNPFSILSQVDKLSLENYFERLIDRLQSSNFKRFSTRTWNSSADSIVVRALKYLDLLNLEVSVESLNRDHERWETDSSDGLDVDLITFQK